MPCATDSTDSVDSTPAGHPPATRREIRQLFFQQEVAGRFAPSSTVVRAAKMAALRSRSEHEWVRLINRIQDRLIRTAVAKKVYWDWFTKARWRSLDGIVLESDGSIRYVTKDTAPDLAEVRVELWSIGYPVGLVLEAFPDTFSYNFSREGIDE